MSVPFLPHRVGCPYARVLLSPGTIAGLLDGDGSFALLARGLGERRRYVPNVAYVVRDDDPTPAWAATSLAELRGAPIGRVCHYAAQRDLGWWVGALTDVTALAGFLTRAPRPSPSGWRQLSAVREAALLLADGRPYRSATEPLARAEVARLREFHASIPRADGAPAEPLPLPAVLDAVDDRYLGRGPRRPDRGRGELPAPLDGLPPLPGPDAPSALVALGRPLVVHVARKVRARGHPHPSSPASRSIGVPSPRASTENRARNSSTAGWVNR